MRLRTCVAALAVGLCAGPAAAEQQIDWKQVSNRELGTSLPPDLKADILGIELGAPYATVKPMMEALQKEGITPDVRRLREQSVSISLSEGDGTAITASYPAVLIVERDLKGTGPRPIFETIKVNFSAPSSGHQVLSIERRIAYSERDDEVRIAEVVKALTDKFRSAPFFDGPTYRWQFNDGNAVVPMGKYPFMSCTGPSANAEEHELANINYKGECDVLLEVVFSTGISPEHTRRISFTLTDYERAKANLTADYGFFANYVNEVRSKTSGAAPKL